LLLAPLQHTLFGFGPDADAEKIVGALDDLQWLSQIMTGHGEEHSLKVGGPLWACPALPVSRLLAARSPA